MTLFERIIKEPKFGPVVRLLDTQYRMNRRISDWASHNMYHDAIHSHPSVAEHTLRDILPRGGGSATLVRSYPSSAALVTITSADSTAHPTRDPERAEEASGTPAAADEGSDQQPVGEDAYPVLLLVDTSGLGMFEDSSLQEASGASAGTAGDGKKKSGASHRNFHEAELVKQHVLSLVRSGA